MKKAVTKDVTLSKSTSKSWHHSYLIQSSHCHHITCCHGAHCWEWSFTRLVEPFFQACYRHCFCSSSTCLRASLSGQYHPVNTNPQHLELRHDQDLLPMSPNAAIHHPAETRLSRLLLSAIRPGPPDHSDISAPEFALAGAAGPLERLRSVGVECCHGSLEYVYLWAKNTEDDGWKDSSRYANFNHSP